MNAESDGGGAEDSDGEDDIMVDIVNIGGLVVMERFDASWQVKIPKIAPLLKATTNGAFVRWKGRSHASRASSVQYFSGSPSSNLAVVSIHGLDLPQVARGPPGPKRSSRPTEFPQMQAMPLVVSLTVF